MKLPIRATSPLVGCLILLIGAAGCGSGGNTVSGKVTYDGRPLSSGVVTFTDSTGKAASGTIDADGSYKVKDSPAGAVKITVQGSAPSAGPPPAKDNAAAGMSAASTGAPIPKRYADPNQSGLSYTVTAGGQTHDILLTP